jgi:hypothetical protein
MHLAKPGANSHLVLVACSSVVDQDIDAAPELDGLFNCGVPIGCLCDVHGLEAEGIGGGGDLFTRFGIDIADEDLGALLGEMFRDAFAEASSGAWMMRLADGSGVMVRLSYQ